MNWLRKIFFTTNPEPLPENILEEKTDQELLDILKKGEIDFANGQKIVVELFDRLLKKTDRC